MHFAILDVEYKKDESGSFVSYGISINGGFHSSLRYSQLRELHDQLKKDFGIEKVPASFPPKKLLSLNNGQIDERREQLEKYLQSVSQDAELVSSRTFMKFLLKAQKESNKVEEDDVKLDVYLMNGKKFQVDIRSTDPTNHVLQEAMTHIKLPEKMMRYFSLFLVQREEEDEELSIVRKLQDCESPYIALLPYKDTHRLVIRKNFWNSKTEDELYTDKIALNLLYVQAVSDVERDWLITTEETLTELNNFKTQNQRKKYLKLVRTQKFYGYLQFKPCVMDFPESNSHAIINVGGFELGFRLIGTQKTKATEGSFKVTRIKCWRVISSRDAKDGELVTKVSFEYLFTKEKLGWITITSDQAMLISLCLQSMVDEIIKGKTTGKYSASKDLKNATKTTSTEEKPTKPSPVTKENPEKPPSANKEQPSANEEPPSANEEQPVKQQEQDSVLSSDSNDGSHSQTNGQKESPSEKRSSRKSQKSKKIAQVKNEVFAQNIGDEDL